MAKTGAVPPIVLLFFVASEAKVFNGCPAINWNKTCQPLRESSQQDLLVLQTLCCSKKSDIFYCCEDNNKIIYGCSPPDKTKGLMANGTWVCDICPAKHFVSERTSKNSLLECRPHSQCVDVGMVVAEKGNATHDAVCGCNTTAGFQPINCANNLSNIEDTCRCEQEPKIKNVTKSWTQATEPTESTGPPAAPESKSLQWYFILLALIPTLLVLLAIGFIIYRFRRKLSSIFCCLRSADHATSQAKNTQVDREENSDSKLID